MLLADKVAIVTGVGAGLGKAAALALAREGAAVALVARTESRLDEVAEEIAQLGGKALAIPGSVANAEDCARIAETVADKLGGIDVVVNSAFRGDKSEPFESADLAFWRKVFEVNLWGPLQLVQACVPAMKARGGGSVVNIASMSARLIRPNDGGYSTSKGALLTATKSMAIDLARYKIRVNAVAPGWILGPNVQTYVDWQVSERGITPDAVIAEITEGIPLGEIPPQEDIAEAIVFFASGMSRMITGQSLGRERRRVLRMTDRRASRRQGRARTGGGPGSGGDGGRGSPATGGASTGRRGRRRRPAGRETVDLVAAGWRRGTLRGDRCDQPGRGDRRWSRPPSRPSARLTYAGEQRRHDRPGGFTADYDVDDWHRTITLNLDTVFYCLRAEIPVMPPRAVAYRERRARRGLVGFAGLPHTSRASTV